MSMLSARLNLEFAGRKLQATVSVPREMHVRDLIPLARVLDEAVVSAAVEDVQAQGKCISCTKGCGACCRQLVPITEIEARLIHELVEAMPEPRRTQVKERFADARRRMESAGMLATLEQRESWQADAVSGVGQEYFKLGIACPFLEEESCSIHPDRPLTCREYLVTSPAAECADPGRKNVDQVPLAMKVWPALARVDVPRERSEMVVWVPLTLALEWAEGHPDTSSARPGPELVDALMTQLATPVTA